MMLTSSFARFLCLALLLAAPTAGLQAQTPMSSGSTPGGGAMQALFLSGGPAGLVAGDNPYVDAHGNPVVVPASFAAPSHGGYHDPYMPGYCESCPGGAGYGAHGHHGRYGLLERIKDRLAYSCLGGDQRGPHYWDVRAEAVWLRRDETFGPDIVFTSDGVAEVVDGLIIPDPVLTSRDLDYGTNTGFRVLGRFDLGPLSVLEFGYTGIFDFSSSASFFDPTFDPVTGTGRLFSLFSDFGLNPPAVQVPFGPMPESERSFLHSIRIESDLQTAEMGFRRYWVGYSPRVSGTLLAGFRYTRLDEDFLFATRGEAAMDYEVRAVNNLAGFQVGNEIWIAMAQGLRVGAEGKVGIYNNRFSLDTIITTDPPAVPPELVERFRGNQVAFISESRVDVVADILPSWSLRAGYEVLWLNSVVLAGENFNPASPYGLPGQEPRVPFLADQGSAFYHGWHAGLEFVW